ncbi:hypothetical protein N7456_003572 [Penicillium angulare]|uniref:Zn(2)-C6 fungal-type domain-containing protein n=1 Tax=Penicillium angulare TaxID=116970 RepID=A0A9W9FWN1_9EURO|nr:hypothetical protein N7456_003572 [Penicillium angulare]
MSPTRRHDLRSRAGCLTCKRRRKKCDERKPICSGCQRNYLDCDWYRSTEREIGESRLSLQQPEREPEGEQSIQPSEIGVSDIPPPQLPDCYPALIDWQSYIPEIPDISDVFGSQFPEIPRAITEGNNDALPSSWSNANLAGGSMHPSISPRKEDHDIASLSTDLGGVLRYIERTGVCLPLICPASLMLLMDSKTTCFLFEHYVYRTASVMAIVDGPANVLKTQLIPFALQSHLGMKAILMTSAIHISDSKPGWSALAWRYYGQVAKCIEDRITMINTGTLAAELVEETLVVCLLLAMFQPIGGSNGALFSRQLRHARKLLCHCQKNEIKLNLRSFIDDSYFYNSMIDSMSWLTRSARTLQQGDLEIDICPITLCSDMIKESYPGWLCGVSHQIMEYVWYASALSRRSHMERQQGNVLSEQIIMEYKELDMLFRSWQPTSDMLVRFPEHCTAAELYRIAGRLYLHRTIHPFRDTTTDVAIQEFVISFLNILKISSDMSKRPRVLCWTFVLVGTCVTSDSHREELMKWLQNSYDYSKMVNCGQTIRLLSKLWWVNDYEEDDMDTEGISSGFPEDADAGRGQSSRCSWDFFYVMRAIRRWDALIS